MCSVCGAVRQLRRERERHVRAQARIRKMLLGRPVEPRPMYYDLFSDPFVLFGHKYQWVMEDEVLTLQKVDWPKAS